MLTVSDNHIVLGGGGGSGGGGVTDHGALTGLSDDDHGQYLLSAGRADGQTITGGTGVTDALTIRGTSGNGTLTSPAIRLNVGNSGGTTAAAMLNNGNFGIGTTSPSSELEVSSAGVETFHFNPGFAPGLNYFKSYNKTTNALVDWILDANNLRLYTSGTAQLTITSGGNSGFKTVSPTADVDINGSTLRLRTSRTPSSASAAGNAGDICWDENYMYVCVATNTWKRSALTTW